MVVAVAGAADGYIVVVPAAAAAAELLGAGSVSATLVVVDDVSVPPSFVPYLLLSILPGQPYTFLVTLFLRRRTASFVHL